MSIALALADRRGLAWAQAQVRVHHYLHAPVDSRCSPLAYIFAEAWDDRATWERDEHYDLVAELFAEGSASLDAAHEAARAQRDDLYQVAGAWDQSVAQWRTAA